MSSAAEACLQMALALSAQERMELADKLFASLEIEHPPGDGSTDAERETSWEAELARRIAEADAGSVEWRTWDLVLNGFK